MAAGRYTGTDLFMVAGGHWIHNAATDVSIEYDEDLPDNTTFAKAGALGGRAWKVVCTARADFHSGQLWRHLWDHDGQEVSFNIRPYGNTTPSDNEPHINGMATMSKPPAGGSAGEIWTYEFTLRCTEEPQVVTS